MDSHQHLARLVRLCVQLLAIVRETRQKATSSGVQNIVELHDAFRSLLKNLDAVEVPYDSRPAHDSQHARILIRDVLLRLEVLRVPPPSLQHLDLSGLLIKVWSDESLGRLESWVSTIQVIATTGITPASDVGSRRLWSGPGIVKPHASAVVTGSSLGNSAETLDSVLTDEVRRTLANADKTELIQEAFLEGLKFAAMNDREEEVADAHERTFAWILDANKTSDDASFATDADNFVSWLTGDSAARIYWINGKAGSGKSTLMRFLASHDKTTSYLSMWAAGLPLTVARFFFWTSGTALQRSQSGLLRALLYEILDQNQDLIPWAFPELWLVAQDTKKRIQILLTWELADLLKGLRRALQLSKGKICLFIDGLDEFEGEEDTVIGLIRDIVDLSTNIKICVSSRPWAAFEKALQNVPHLLLQDLTREDMEQYISSQFGGHEATRNAMEKDQLTFEALRAAMVDRANGVFLWTSLALRTIVNDLSEGCCMDDIQKRLSRLPSDLEDLFRYLLFDHRNAEEDRSDELLLSQHQSHIVQTMRARDEVCDFTRDDSIRAMNLYQMVLADSDHPPDSSTIHQCDIRSLGTMCREFSNILERSCSHLIVLGGGQSTSQSRVHSRHHGRADEEDLIMREANRRVHYCHRTVRDFFVSSGVWPEILARSRPGFDPHIALLGSHVLRLRLPLEQPEQHRRLDEWWHDDVVPAMTHARLASSTTATTQVQLLDRLDQTLNWYWRKKAGDPLDNWARQAFGTYEERMKHKTPFHDPFLSLAAKFGCANYLDLKLFSGPNYDFRAGVPLLTHALDLLIDRRKTVYPLSSPEVIAAILKSGQNVNQQYLDMRKQRNTPWLYALKCVREGHRRGWMQSFDQGAQRWGKILNLMLDYGADVEAVIEKDEWDPEVTAKGVIEKVAVEYFDCDVWMLLERMAGVMIGE